jgi:hypothetical protein
MKQVQVFCLSAWMITLGIKLVVALTGLKQSHLNVTRTKGTSKWDATWVVIPEGHAG